MKRSIVLFFFILITACGKSSPALLTATSIPYTETPTMQEGTRTEQAVIPSPTSRSRLLPEEWQNWPVVPVDISDRVREIYQRGQELGLNPQAYSKIGDCESAPAWFLGAFDGKTDGYSLGSFADLQEVIDIFRGSHGRTSLAAGRGFSAANVLSSIWSDQEKCETDETPISCEIRIHRPSYALIMLGTNDIYNQDSFKVNLGQILEILVGNGVVPILATKADNLEGDQAINLEIARFAYEFDLPLWNFWLAVQPLPAHGLQEDGSHLTWAGPYFDDPIRMLSAWPWRNLTALQTLDSVWRAVTAQP